MREDPQIVEVEMAAVRGLLERAEALLSREDYELLKGLVESLLSLTRLVRERGTTIARLRRLVGFTSSEKAADVLGQQGERCGAPSGGTGATDPAGPGDAGLDPDKGAAPAPDEPTAAGEARGPSSDISGTSTAKAKGHGRVPASAYPDARRIAVAHESLRPGDACPACARGTIYQLKDSAQFLRIVGQPPLVAVCWDCQRLRCSACGEVYTARPPEEAQGEKHTETAASMMGLLRYSAGMPLNRLEHLQRHLETPVPSSTQWDVVNERVSAVEPVYHELTRLAAQGSVVHNDDTYMRILEFMGRRRAALLRSGNLPDPERTGLFTTAIVAIVDAGRAIALFFTGRKHAGENLTELLSQRAADLAPPILMSDALARNLPTGYKVVESNCIAHGRRKIVDEVENFPDDCRYLLEMLGHVYKVDALCREQGLSDELRLRMHQRQSGPVMDELKEWMMAQFAAKRIEPNSGLGDAINYLLKRWDKFTLFLREPGAPLDNNIAERALKKAIQHRKNSLFYRSQRGARVGDIYMTLIHTTELHDENAFHYLTALMRHAKAVAENPGEWLPWSYRDTLSRQAGHETRGRDPDQPKLWPTHAGFGRRPPAPTAPPTSPAPA